MASLDFSKITDGTLEGTGYFDLATQALKAHITDIMNLNHITQAEAGQVYSSVLPSLFKDAIAFEVQDVQVKLGKIPTVLK